MRAALVLALLAAAGAAEDPLPEGARLRIGRAGILLSLHFSPDGGTLASAGISGTVRLWDPGTGKEVRSIPADPVSVFSARFSPDGRILAAAGGDGTVRLFEAASGRDLRELKGHATIVYSLAFSPDGKRLASSGEDGILKLWETGTGEERLSLPAERAGVGASVAFSPDGRTLALASQDGRVRLWDAESGREVARLEGLAEALAFSPDGRILAAACEDGSVALWETASGGEIRSLRGHEGAVLSIAFSPDGRLLASGGRDRTLKLRDAFGGDAILERQGKGFVSALTFSPDGRTLASGGPEGSILLWRVPPPAKGADPSPLGPDRLASLWTDLASEDAGKAFQGVRALSGAPDAAAFLASRMAPADASRLEAMISELDADDYDRREAATRALEALAGSLASVEARLKKALEASPSDEAKVRLEEALKGARRPRGERLRMSRALWALEWSGSPEARAALEAVAAGPEGELAREAKAARERMGKN